MAEIDDLYRALEKADAAGNADDAREIAGHIRALESAALADRTPAAPAAAEQPAQAQPRGSKGFFESGGGLEAGLVNAGEAATFGALGPVAAFIASTASKFGNGQPLTYAQARQRQLDYEAELNAENPISATAGSLAGSLAGGLGLVKGGLAAARGVGGAVGGAVERAIASGTPRAGAGIGENALRLAKGGAASGAATSAAEQGVKAAEAGLSDVDMRSDAPVSDALASAAIGGIAGPVVGGAAALAGRGAAKVRDLVTGNELGGGWRYLARKLGVEPDDLQTALNDYSRLTGGQRASLAQVMDMKQQGVLADIASAKPSAGVSFRRAADEATEALPDQTRDLLRGTTGIPRNAEEMGMATRAPADRFMADVRQRGDSISLTRQEAKALGTPDFIAATRDLPPELRSRVAQALNGQGDLSTHELDIIRQHVGAWADTTPGARNAAAPIRQQLEALAERSSPGYMGQTVRATEAGKLREEGFAAGQRLESNTGVSGATMRGGPELEGYGEGVARRTFDTAGQGSQGAGRALDELSSGRNMQDALSSAYGTQTADELVQGARALRSGQQALENVAPRSIGAGDGDSSAADLAAAGVAAAHGSYASKMFRAVKAVGSARISDQAAGRIADMLTSSNPRQIDAALQAMRRAGADDQAIATLQGHAARLAGNRAAVRDEPLVVTVRKRAGR